MKKKLEHMCKRIPYTNKTRVGIIAGIALKLTGMMDAENNLVTKDSNGVFSSPFSKSEADKYTAVADMLWSVLQDYHKDSYVKMQESYTVALELQKQIGEYNRYLSDFENKYKDGELIRKPGDESLSDAQVRSRRSSETEKMLSDKRRHLASLNKKLLAERKLLAKLYTDISEDIGFIRLKQQAAQIHFNQRSDIYWKSAEKALVADSDTKFIVPPETIFPDMDSMYMENHGDMLKKVENIITEG